MTPEVQSTGIAATLGLDYKLFLAQLVNFGLVLLVIWKWVYKPLARTLDERSKKIEQGLLDAEGSRKMLESSETERQKVITEARLRAREIIESAETDAGKRRDQMFVDAKTEVERVVAEGKQRLRDDQAALIAEARKQLAEVVLAATEKVMGEKVDKKKDAELVRAALKSLE